jgi:hypothetical protein
MRKWPTWAKVSWYVAWAAGMAGMIFGIVKPNYIALRRIVRVYGGVLWFFGGLVAFCDSFSADLKATEQVPNPRAMVRNVGVALMAGAVLYFCLLLWLPRPVGLR